MEMELESNNLGQQLISSNSKNLQDEIQPSEHTKAASIDIPVVPRRRKICYGLIFSALIVSQFCDILSFSAYYNGDSVVEYIGYFIFKCWTSTVYLIIMTLSIYHQRGSLQSLTLSGNAMQSHLTNMLLSFAGLLYFGVLTAVTTFYGDSDLILAAISNILSLIGCVLLAAHMVGNLKWGHITPCNRFDCWTPNWWANIYLLIGFCIYMMVTVVGPWLDVGYSEFVALNRLIKDNCGVFVHTLIMYGCRPSLTIVVFRTIEQILHQLIYQNEMEHHHHHNSSKTEFKGITAMDVLILCPILLFVIVFDLVNLTKPTTNITVKMNYFIWFLLYFIQCLWASFIIAVYRRDGMLRKKEIFTNHLSLFISATGTVVAIIGTLGTYRHNGIWQMYLVSSADLIFVVLQCVVIVLLNESKLKEFDCKHWITTPRIVTLYGKVVIICNLMLLFHAFLGEAAHLDHVMHDEYTHHDQNDIFAALEFIFFFWRIEYHLAVIERVNLTG